MAAGAEDASEKRIFTKKARVKLTDEELEKVSGGDDEWLPRFRGQCELSPNNVHSWDGDNLASTREKVDVYFAEPAMHQDLLDQLCCTYCGTSALLYLDP
ncbi:MAG: hypothetical protein K6G83_05695 [Lachnospiraceae bacterium]|nr:hypothetical protein [Lachnospiraceae bacterium]